MPRPKETAVSEKKKTSGSAKSFLTLDAVMAEDADGRKERKRLHDYLSSAVYVSQIRARLTKTFQDEDKELLHASGPAFALEQIKRMNPRDPFEEMLVAQATWAHLRVAHLSLLANHQTEIVAVESLHELAGKASNSFRRLILALKEYRRPPRTGDSFTAIGQANIANQQVVQNAGSANEKNKNVTNEQGCDDDTTSESNSVKALPAESGGIEVAEAGGATHETVDPQHRSQDDGG